MKRMLLVFQLFLPLLVSAQNRYQIKGIEWAKAHRWEKIKQAAKLENKYIFVDCYATWCRPCKAMDKEIYSLQSVGDIVNEKFIPVRVQMDSSNGDNDEVRSWYSDAHLIMTKYQVNAFPTFLFFAPNGNLVHKGIGFKNEQDFIKLISDATNPRKQYFKLLDEFKKGIWDTASLKQLARATNEFGDKELAQKMAETYITSQSEESLYKKETIQFMIEFIRNTNQKAFGFFYNNSDRINKLMNDDDYSQVVVSFVISKEFIAPILASLPKDKEPDWKTLETTITNRYNNYYALRAIAKAKMNWLKNAKRWSEYVRLLSDDIERKYKNKALDNFWLGVALNNDCMELVRYASDTTILNKGISWMQKLFSANFKNATDEDYVDTYANLLYKSGKVEDGMFWENKAVLLSDKREEYQQTYQKMVKGLPTWPIQ